jgi:hypothetical protein
METIQDTQRVFRSNEKNDLLLGVIISHSIAGWSTWNDHPALVTDPLLIAQIEEENTPGILRRATEIYPEGRFSAANNLSVMWVPTGTPFRIVYNKEHKREAIEWYKEEEWICG